MSMILFEQPKDFNKTVIHQQMCIEALSLLAIDIYAHNYKLINQIYPRLYI